MLYYTLLLGELEQSPMTLAIFVEFGFAVLGVGAMYCAGGELRRTRIAGGAQPAICDLPPSRASSGHAHAI
jgi:hypothetical protein